MNPFKKDEAPFLVDAFEHAGRYRGARGGTLKCWEVKDTMIKPFSDITTAVCTELDTYPFPRSTVVMFDLFLRGTSSSSVEVFVMLAGATEKHRRKAVKHLKKSSVAKNYPGLKMDHWDWPPDAPHVVMMASDNDNILWATVYRSQGYEIRFSGKAPDRSTLDKLGDISFHIVASNRGSAGYHGDFSTAPNSDHASRSCHLCQRLRLQCTFGTLEHGYGSCLPCHNSDSECSFVSRPSITKEKMGVLSHYVVEGGRRYLLAPAHIFLDDEPEEGDEVTGIDDSDVSESNSDIESSFDVMLRAGSATPPDLASQLEPVSDSATEETPLDRMPVFEPTTRQEGKQPELPCSNVAPPNPWAEILSIELDYALIPFPPEGGPDFKAGLSYLVQESTASFWLQNALIAEHTVWVTTPSQGLMRATISARPVMMRLPYSRAFSMLYPLNLPSPVQKGDCGSVIFDQQSRVYGFIAAGSTAGNIAYIVPATEILKDIRLRSAQVSATALEGLERGQSLTQVRTIQEATTNAPLFGDEAQNIRRPAATNTGPDPATLNSPSRELNPAQDELSSDRLREIIDHLATKNEALQAKIDRLNKDVNIQEAEIATGKTALEAQAETIEKFEWKLAALSEAHQQLIDRAGAIQETVSCLQEELAERPERQQQPDANASSISLPLAGNDNLSGLWRTASPSRTLNKTDSKSTDGLPRRGRTDIQQSLRALSNVDSSMTPHNQFEGPKNDLLSENLELKATTMRLRDHIRKLSEDKAVLLEKLDRVTTRSDIELDARLRHRLGGEFSGSNDSSSIGSYSSSAGSRTTASSTRSGRSVTTGGSSASGSIRRTFAYRGSRTHPESIGPVLTVDTSAAERGAFNAGRIEVREMPSPSSCSPSPSLTHTKPMANVKDAKSTFVDTVQYPGDATLPPQPNPMPDQQNFTDGGRENS